MSGFMKTVLMSTPQAWDFSKKIHRLFHSIIHRQCVNTQPTHQPCLCICYQLVARLQGYLLLPSLTEVPQAFAAPQRPASRLTRQAKKFCCKFDTVFINSDIYTIWSKRNWKLYTIIIYRLMHSVGELSGFTCTSAVLKMSSSLLVNEGR